ncbi:MAG: prepilin-type N-terminal cleavage/methylation domain-containing protein [Elusimicrobiaceae bacterium]|nr:prepilin-type N-terminal cleavage/methylation domain-containing protein [Elusimicrobiaceae bacterium]
MKQNNQAFTLIELLVVVLIIGILAAIALPQYKLAVLKSRFVQAKLLVNAFAKAQEIYYEANGTYAPSFAQLDIDTPYYIEQSESTTLNSRTFEWGMCWTAANDEYGSRVVCSLNKNDKITLYKYLNHSDHFPGQYLCRTYNTDLNSTPNKLCKQESGLSTGTSQTNYYDWRWTL